MLKVSNRNTRKKCEICSKVTIKTPERSHLRRSDVFIVNFEPFSGVPIVDFEQVNINWGASFDRHFLNSLSDMTFSKDSQHRKYRIMSKKDKAKKKD